MPHRVIRYSKDQAICRQGGDGDCAYLINRGSVDISIWKDGRHILIERLQAGQLFGELALLDEAPRSATATTETGCELREISKAFLSREMQAWDPFLRVQTSLMRPCDTKAPLI